MAETLIKKLVTRLYYCLKQNKITDLGKFDKVMTYGEALKECEKLIEENQEKTFWPEKSEDSKEGFAFP